MNYSNLSDLFLLNQFEIEIEISELEIAENNGFIIIKLNEEVVFCTAQKYSNLNVIVFDGGIGIKKIRTEF